MTFPAERPRREFLGLHFDALDLDDTVAWLAARTAESPFGYVVTPNVDHVVRLERRPELRPLYEGAALCLCDSRVLQRIARAFGVRLPLAPGSDLTRRLMEELIRPGDRIALVGGKEGDAAALARLFPGVDFVQSIPPMGLATNATARGEAADRARAARARFVLLAVGSPQQEQVAAAIGDDPAATGTALCIGASIDFLTGAERRAPALLQRAGMEWAWRLAGNPRRLWKRYLVDGAAILPIVRRWLRTRHSG